MRRSAMYGKWDMHQMLMSRAGASRAPGYRVARVHGAAQMFAWQVRTDQLIRTVIYMQRLRLLLVQRVVNSKPAASLCRTLF